MLRKGAHSPDVRAKSQGVFPIQALQSKIAHQEDVSVSLKIDFCQVRKCQTRNNL